jgi:cytochrome oxidase assembly protein ShyY1
VYRFLLTRRWLGLTAVLLLLATPMCLTFGRWQLDRYQQRSAANETLRRNLAAEPVPVAALTSPAADVPQEQRGRRARASGRYDPARELLVRNRPQQGRTGFYVLTPLVTADGTAVLVNRGWIGAGAEAASRPAPPAPPAGTVTVTGRLRPAETPRASGLRDRAGAPPGQVYLIDGGVIGRSLPYPVARGSLELTDSQPTASPAPAPVPAPRPANTAMNLAYVVQWNLFAAGAVGAWLVMVWREARSRRGAALPAASPTPTGAEPDGSTPRWPAASKTTR